ncbi:hypothetical protein J7L49_01615 [Candidatus Bathyarchaeota archaeon]|nr:hypothetical protein [Candidatus Bathyarchaeota archaeon]
MKTKFISLVVIAVLLLGFLAVPLRFANATYPTTLRVEPTEIHKWTDVDHPLDTFTVSIIADVVSPDEFFGWEFILTWTPGIINCTGETINYNLWGGNFLGPWVSTPIDNNAGTYHQSLTGKSPGTPVSGTYWLVNLTFVIVAEPEYGEVLNTTLHLEKAPGFTAYCLLDGEGNEIQHYYVDGNYYYHWAPPKVNPHLEVEYTGEPGVHAKTFAGKNIYKYPFSFSVDINIYNVDPGWRMAGVELLLTYNTTLLDVLSVQNGSFFEPFTPTTWFFYQIFEDEGKIRIVYTILDIPHMTPPYGNGKIATIVFNATYQERFPASVSSPLNITIDTENGMSSYFVNFKADEIPYDPEVDGYYELAGYVVGRVIDVYTQYPAPYGGQGPMQPSDMFWPQEQVELYANVTYNDWPVQQKDVAFSIYNPQGELVSILTARTNEYGVAHTSFRIPWPCDDPESLFGVWNVTATVDIAEVTVNDTLWFHFDYLIHWMKVTTDKTDYNHGENINVTITFGSYAMQTYNVLIAVTIQDELNVPIGTAYVNLQVGGATWCTLKNYETSVEIQIPKFAAAGMATIYVSALNDFPINGGNAVTPQYSPAPQVNIVAK